MLTALNMDYLRPFYSNLGHGLLTNMLLYTLKDTMKSIIILFNQITCDKIS